MKKVKCLGLAILERPVNITVIWRLTFAASAVKHVLFFVFLRKGNNETSVLKVQAKPTKFSRPADQIPGTCASLSTNMTVL
jgi:hypothetical protein